MCLPLYVLFHLFEDIATGLSNGISNDGSAAFELKLDNFENS